MAKNEIYPVYIVSGKDAFLRERFLRTFVAKMVALRGYTVSRVPGTVASMGALDSATAGSVLVDDCHLVIFDNLVEEMVTPIESWHLHGSSEEALLVVHLTGDGAEPDKPNSKTKTKELARFVALLKDQHKTFPEAKPWEAEDRAKQFLVAECQVRGKVLREDLAGGVIHKVGSDLGVLFFEALKACTLADARGQSVINADVLRGSMAVVSEVSIQSLLAVLVSGKTKEVAKALDQITATHKASSGLAIRVAASLGPQLVKIVAAADMHANGVTPNQAVLKMGGDKPMHAYAYQQGTLQTAIALGQVRSRSLLSIMAAGQRGQLAGHQDAWVELQTELLKWVANSPR